MTTPRTDAHLNSVSIENEDSCCSIYVKVDGVDYHGELATADFARAIEAELQAAHSRIRELEGLREGDNKLILALAEDAGIKITCNPKMLGLVWEQFHDGVMRLRNPSFQTPPCCA